METYNLYNGEIEIRYDSDNHKYFIGEREIDGVSSVLNIISKPKLNNWKVIEGINHIKNSLKEGKYSQEDISEIIQTALSKPKEKREVAAGFGKDVHRAVEGFIKGQEVEITDPKIKNRLDSFKLWATTMQAEFIYSEKIIYSKQYDYCGTFDFLAKINDKYVLGDIKTNKSVHPEMFLQTSAYQWALEEELGIDIDRRVIVHLKDDIKVYESSSLANDFDAFLGALTLKRRIEKLENDL